MEFEMEFETKEIMKKINDKIVRKNNSKKFEQIFNENSTKLLIICKKIEDIDVNFENDIFNFYDRYEKYFRYLDEFEMFVSSPRMRVHVLGA